MRNLFLVVIAGLLFGACSVNNEELEMSENKIQEFNALVDIAGCDSNLFELKDDNTSVGSFEVTNDQDYLYISLVAAEGFYLTESKLQVGNTIDDFPMNNGGIIPGKLDKENNIDFGTGVKSYTYKFHLDDFNLDSDCMSIASLVTFNGVDGKTYKAWAGDMQAGKNDSRYLDYCLCNPCSVDAGSPNSITRDLQYVLDELNTPKDIRYEYLMLLDEGVPEDGTFEPSIQDIIDAYALLPDPKTGTFPTVYTVTGEAENGDTCSDSTTLTIFIVE